MIEANRQSVIDSLVAAERRSGKGLRDWHKTDRRAREYYLSLVLDISDVDIFYTAYDRLHSSACFGARADVLAAAIRRFSPGDCHHMVLPEGLKGAPRRQLLNMLIGAGCSRVTVESVDFFQNPEVRLADAMAGMIRAEIYRGGNRAPLTNIPERFVDLEDEKRNPPKAEASEGQKAENALLSTFPRTE